MAREWICEVKVGGKTYARWTSVACRWGIEASEKRLFDLQLAEPNAERTKDLRLKPGDVVDITLGGKPFIVEGSIAVRQTAYDANRHGVMVSGFSKAGPLDIASADVKGGQFTNAKIDAIANSVLQPYGVKFRVKGGPEGWDMPFRSARVAHGETPFEFIERLARQRGLWLAADEHGDIEAGNEVKESGVTLEEGRNILAASCYLEDPAAGTVVGRSQMQGSDGQSGKKVAQVSAKATIPGGNPTRKVIVLDETASNQRELQMRVDHEARKMLAEEIRVQVTHLGWFKPGTEDLWRLRELVTVKSPMLFPAGPGSLPLVVSGVTYSQDAQGGTTTTLDLVNEAVFGRKNGPLDGTYSRAPEPAVPQAVT
ncbi:phage baseplate assembly protein [Salinarimonas soli]|uniref:Phage tail protein n=1 Tax=Salinarimonas soli TaxID=1638099 RepID=A0A5B2VBY3_9HYPH|nr:hypothetical protein [Salinarimonas soli]KAA2236953.1 hypothetical protein F0L46_11820 [Salinarimonas soli]